MSGFPVDLTDASLEELKQIPGVGEKKGKAILTLRANEVITMIKLVTVTNVPQAEWARLFAEGKIVIPGMDRDDLELALLDSSPERGGESGELRREIAELRASLENQSRVIEEQQCQEANLRREFEDRRERDHQDFRNRQERWGQEWAQEQQNHAWQSDRYGNGGRDRFGGGSYDMGPRFHSPPPPSRQHQGGDDRGFHRLGAPEWLDHGVRGAIDSEWSDRGVRETKKRGDRPQSEAGYRYVPNRDDGEADGRWGRGFRIPKEESKEDDREGDVPEQNLKEEGGEVNLEEGAGGRSQPGKGKGNDCSDFISKIAKFIPSDGIYSRGGSVEHKEEVANYRGRNGKGCELVVGRAGIELYESTATVHADVALPHLKCRPSMAKG